MFGDIVIIGGRVKSGRPPYVQFYTEKKSRDYEEFVAGHVRQQIRGIVTQGDGDFLLPFTDVRVVMSLRFTMPRPKSYPKRITWHTVKPDNDNLSKGILDGLVKGSILKDDNCVTDLNIMKRYPEPGHPVGVEIDMTVMPCEVP